MRRQSLRLRKKTSTKSERRIGEILKRNRIKFKTKWKIGDYEADFVIGRLIIEIDGKIHKETNAKKDTYFVSKGFVPVHLSAYAKDVEAIEKEIISLIYLNN